MLPFCCYNLYMEKNTKKQRRMSVYFPPRVQEALAREAARQHRSINGQVVWCVEQCLGLREEEQSGVPDQTRPHRQDEAAR
jgi:hypothetical protein